MVRAYVSTEMSHGFCLRVFLKKKKNQCTPLKMCIFPSYFSVKIDPSASKLR